MYFILSFYSLRTFWFEEFPRLLPLGLESVVHLADVLNEHA